MLTAHLCVCAHIQKNVIGVQFHVFGPQLMAITGILQCGGCLNDGLVLGRDTVLHWMQAVACTAMQPLGNEWIPGFKIHSPHGRSTDRGKHQDSGENGVTRMIVGTKPKGRNVDVRQAHQDGENNVRGHHDQCTIHEGGARHDGNTLLLE